MRRGLCVVLIGVLLGCVAPTREVCVIPNLPPWNHLVLTLWASGRIPDQTFLKNFPISGEYGDKFLRKQGYDPARLNDLARCILNHFKG